MEQKNILVTGSTGMIGRELVEQLKIKEPKAIIRYADLSLGIDLRYYNTCLDVMEGIDEVFSLMGITGSPKMTSERPIDFFVPMIQCGTNILEAARLQGVKKFLYTSSVAVLNPDTDKYPAAAKQMGEFQIEAYKIQYPEFGNNCCVIRPSNVYGRYGNFKNIDAMVITSLIRKALTCDTIEVWGDGSETREFINAKDVARGMILAMDQMPNKPINLGSGKLHSIKQAAEILSRLSGKEIVYIPKEKRGGQTRVVFEDPDQGDIGFKAITSLEEGITEAYNYAKGTL
ncbi:MAG: NAD-dependent epimerase/dehydratase family protein [Candidatus Omnitrophica bacterium]|jgi:nucleoside-diphosphate-sugar epimerase|nr:NAD-dependent epimerase/dehydratase family protein [Candidatus Omnitrophota bacterium]